MSIPIDLNFLGYIIGFVVTGTTTLSLMLLSDGFLQRRSTHRIYIGFLACFFITFITLNFTPWFHGTSISKSCFLVVIGTITLIFCYNGSFLKCFLTACGCYVFQLCISCIIAGFTALLLQDNINVLYSSPAISICFSFIEQLVLFFFSFLFRKTRKAYSFSGNPMISWKNWVRLGFFPTFSILVFILLVNNNLQNDAVSLGFVFSCLILFTCNIFFVQLIDQLEHESILQQENVILAQQISAEMKNAQALMDAYTIQRKLTHDFTNHLSVLNGLVHAKKYSTASEYISSLLESPIPTSNIVNTNNPIIDTVLNQKYQSARNYNIAVLFSISDLSSFPMKAEDIVVVLTNVLDNAIDACQKQKTLPKIIDISFKKDNDTYLLSIRNTTDAQINIVDSHIATSKENRLLHGWGLKNVQATLSKYDYSYALQLENGWFQFSVLFC